MAVRRTKPALRLQAYHLVSEAVENGVVLGWNRAHKHTDTPSAEAVHDAMARSVMERLAEIVDWERSG
jgi:hypothetical protein